MSLRILLSLIVMLISLPVFAADVGECETPEVMTAKLKAEDQHSIASAQRITLDKKLLGIIVTMNPDRSVGYILQADRPMGARASKICVYTRLADVRMFDARKAGTPSEVLLKAPEADALRRCGELAQQGKVPQGSCGSLNTMIARQESSGQRAMIQGFVVARQPDGAYGRDGTLATISANVSGSVSADPDNPLSNTIGDIMFSSLPDGATILNATLIFARYTEFGLAALK